MTVNNNYSKAISTRRASISRLMITSILPVLLNNIANGFIPQPMAKLPRRPSIVASLQSTVLRITQPEPQPPLRASFRLASVSSSSAAADDAKDADTEPGDTAKAYENEPMEAPSVKKILEFAIPAIGIWLCSPLLSLIDTSTVGLLCGTAQQAALNPAIACTDYSARILYFLYTGTTNMIASANNGNSDNSVTRPSTARLFAGALHLSLLIGLGLGSILLLSARPMVNSLIGNDVLDPEVYEAAIRYVRIRSLGMPVAAMTGTAQAACLGLKDVKSPLYVILFSSLVNLMLDLALVGHPHPWIGGTAGAAWATTMAQYCALGLFLKWLVSAAPVTKDSGTTDTSQHWSQRFPWRTERSANARAPSTRGYLSGRFGFQQLLRLPHKDVTSGFQPYLVPVTTSQVGRCSTYIAMGHVVSSTFGTVEMAANQIITSIFYTLIPIADSLSQTAQSFLPGILSVQASAEKSRTLRQTCLNLLKVAGLFGFALASTVACIPFSLPLFTTDQAVMTAVKQIIPILLLIFSVHGVFCGSEGILLGHRDLRFLGRMYALFFAVVPYLILRVKSAAQAGAPVGLSAVWKLFLGYQLFRIMAWVTRVSVLQKRADKLVPSK